MSWTAHSHDDETYIGGLTVLGIGAQHAEILPDLPRIANTGVLVSAGGEPTLFHPGDSYEHTPDGVDVLALPLVAPWAKISETVDFVTRVSPTTLFPIHDSAISELGPMAPIGGMSRNSAASTMFAGSGQTESTTIG